jgi:hypothetical protein
MKSDMHESVSSLAPVNYSPYIKLLQEIVQHSPLFTVSQKVLQVEAANVAFQTAQQMKAREGTRKALSPLFSFTLGTRMATVHLDGERTLSDVGKQVEVLRELIKTQLDDAIRSSTLPLGKPEDYIGRLPFPLKALHRSTPQGLHYPFLTAQAFTKRRVHIHSQASHPADSSIRYRGHKLSIILERTGTFEDDLIDGFCLLLQGQGATPDEIAEVRAVLEQGKQDPASELARLKKLAKEETLGKIKGEACWRFWNEVVEAMTRSYPRFPSVSPDEQEGLAEMRRQLRMLTRFRQVLQNPAWSDTDFQVSYMDESFNMRTVFARADAYDVLPIFPEVVGTLGEVQDMAKDEQLFAYGMRFKLNGAVGRVESTFQYYVTLLDPTNPEHQERLTSPLWNKRRFAEEVMRIALLYQVLFVLSDDAQFELKLREFLVHLATDDPQTKAGLLQQHSQSLLQRSGLRPRVEIPIEQARNALEKYFSHASVGPTIDPFFGYLVLQNGMLRLDLNRMLVQKRFFRQELFDTEEQRKEALRYVTIQDAVPQQDAFYALPLHLTFEPIYLSDVEAERAEAASMIYDIADWWTLPVFFVPDTQTSRTIAETVYARYRRVVIPYREQSGFALDAPETALYRWAFLLLTYLCLDILWTRIIVPLFRQQCRFFFPMIRVHEREPETGRDQGRFPNEGKVIRGMTKTLAHIFSCERFTLSNAQGFTHEALLHDQYRLGNGLSSLYNVLPRIITRPDAAPNALDKLAIIIISSRRCDLHTASTFQRMCVYGEMLGCTRLSDGKLRIEQLSTFAVNEDSDNLYTTPRTLLDQVRRCSQAGYKHIFYIAKAPYTSHVHFTGKEDDEELFFMSPSIIGGVLQTFPDIMLYPMFCDRYYVIKVNKAAMPESLYVDDTRELRMLFTDPSKSTVVFFNVMNGIQIRPTKSDKGHRYYNGVVSYATLINMYANPLYDQAIRNNLLDGSQPGSLRTDMLDFLAYVHGVRYERREKRGIQLKLDPYEACIGFDSVGARSIIPSLDFRVNTNTLAFLTLIRGTLRRNQRAGGVPPSSSPLLTPPGKPTATEKGASDVS